MDLHDDDNFEEARRLRQLVLDFAAEKARELIAATKGTPVQTAGMSEVINGGTMKWDVTVHYFQIADTVSISGRPTPEHNGMMGNPLFHMFASLGGVQTDDGSFTFHVPAAWLPTTDEAAADLLATAEAPR